MRWPFLPKHRNLIAEIEAQTISGNAAALARRKAQLDRAKRDDMTAQLNADIAAGRTTTIPDRSQVVATVLRGNGIRRQREEARG